MCTICQERLARAVGQLAGERDRRAILKGALATAMVSALGAGGMAGARAQVVRPIPAITSSVYRFNVGRFACASISDGVLEFPAAWYAVNVPGAAIDALLTRNFLPPGTVRNPTSSLYVDTGTHRILFDTGMARFLAAQAGPLAGALSGMGLTQARLAAAGLDPRAIDIVVITHGHPDHIGGLTDADGTPIFPNARYLMSRPEFDFWAAANASGDFNAMVAKRGLAAMERRLDFLAPGDEVVPGIRALDAAGHTPGHMAFEIASGSDLLLHLCDASGHYVIGLAEPDWALAFDADPVRAVAVRRRLFDRAAVERALTFNSHFPWPGIGHVRAVGRAWEWVPVPWEYSVQ